MEASQHEKFNALDSQREYCEAFVTSQRGDGWELLPVRYDDGGFSGGTLQRPAMQRLLADVDAGSIDVIIVYKIDRLTRSLRDFVSLLTILEAKKVHFVSVTQSFDTRSSMGRLTLNVLLSFAQFERELTSERLSDFFARARVRGLWMNSRPYGYIAVESRLVIVPDEAAVVRRVFSLYPKFGSCRLVADRLTKDGIFSKNGKPFSPPSICHMLKHRVYRGEIVYRRQGVPGTAHEPIVSEFAWQKVQTLIRQGRERRKPLLRCPVDAMLKDLVHDQTGHRMHHTFMHAKGRLYRYYISGHEKLRYGPGSNAATRFRASELECAVLEAVDKLAGTSPLIVRSNAEKIGFVRSMVSRIAIRSGDMVVTLKTGAVLQTPHAGQIGANNA